MPESALDPDGLQWLARNLLAVPANFTSEKAKGPVSPNRVPANIRTELEKVRTALLDHIVVSRDFAHRLNEAVQREDRDTIRELLRSSFKSTQRQASGQVELEVTGVDSDFYFGFKGCLFGFCVFLEVAW